MSTFFSLDGKCAVVTGGSQGIGLAIAERLAAAGAHVVIADLSDGSAVAERLGGRFVRTDVSDEDSVAALMQAAHEAFGPIGIVVNNAGVANQPAGFLDTTGEDFDFCHRVNTMGVAFGIKQAVPLMAPGGSIINTASMAGRAGVVGLSAYAASKAAILGLTKTAAVELGPRQIRVNAVCPISVHTPMAEEGDQSLLDMERLMVPLGRICVPEEVAAAVHFLASSDASFINGQAIEICGGMYAGVSEAAWEKLAGSPPELTPATGA